jgi:hypothetical protein
MDTGWFAVDRDGRVGVFDTDNCGHAPADVRVHENGDAIYDLLDWYQQPGPVPDPRRFVAMGLAAELARMGVFYFYYELHDFVPEGSLKKTLDDVPFYSRYGLCPWEFAGPYLRALVPAELLHADQLPPELRRRVKRYRLDGLSFVEQEFVQPAEYFACTGSWHKGCRAYLCGDGRTLRPWPGKKDAFGQFIREFLAGGRRRAEWFSFDWSADRGHGLEE